MVSPILELSNINKSFGHVHANKDINLIINKGTIHGIIGENGAVKLIVRDKKNDTSNVYSVVVAESNDEFSFNFKVENIRVVPGTYEVKISKKLLACFTSKDHDLRYFIALEPDSTFG